MLVVSLSDLPRNISAFDAVEQCYQTELRSAFERLQNNVSIIIRCEKQIIPYLSSILKRRLSTTGKTTCIIDGRPRSEEDRGSRVNIMMAELRNLVNNLENNKVFFLPYLDVLTSTKKHGMSMEAREIMTIIHENPSLNLVAFEDPDFVIPDLVAQAFPARYEMTGIARNRLGSMITESEARKFAVDEINLMSIYKFVSGLNPVKFREIMGIFSQKADYDPAIEGMLSNYLKELRSYTTSAETSLSEIDLNKDIAGYNNVKKQITDNILSLLASTNKLTDEKKIKKIESIIPRGLIFHGPPGTGKTLFAKGIAEALNAAIYIVSGPELKSKWVGEGEERIRALFARARATAPSVIVFDELDSIAMARSASATDGASQSAHSMVNQLLTEMDGFKKEQMVLVVGTTNFLDSIDSAFLRPGRFEYQIEIPYPEWEDRLAILSLYNKKFETKLNEEQLETLTAWTERPAKTGMPHTGDHLNALIKDLKRFMINNDSEVVSDDLLNKWLRNNNESIKLSPEEERVVAIHESGHALMFFRFNMQHEIKRITIESAGANNLGQVESESDFFKKPVITEGRLKAEIGISLGGYCAEKIFTGEVSTGAYSDLKRATSIATRMVTAYGMSSTPREYEGPNGTPDPCFIMQISPEIDKILKNAMTDSKAFLEKNKKYLDGIVTELLKTRTLDLDKLKLAMKNGANE